MSVLVTRPAALAEGLATALRSRGQETLIEPLLAVRFLPPPGDLGPAQAILFTSANGVRAFAAATSARVLPAFAVGDRTAAAAYAAGFARVTSAGGTVEDLARLVAITLRPADGALLHAAGSVTAGDLAGRLGAAGFTVQRLILYEAVPATRLSDAASRSLRDGAVETALFFSPRTATTFVRLAREAGLGPACRNVTALALSGAVAAALGGLAWRGMVLAATPTEAGLLAAFDRMPAPRDSERERSA